MAGGELLLEDALKLVSAEYHGVAIGASMRMASTGRNAIVPRMAAMDP